MPIKRGLLLLCVKCECRTVYATDRSPGTTIAYFIKDKNTVMYKHDASLSLVSTKTGSTP